MNRFLLFVVVGQVRRFRLSEQAEVDAAVSAVLNEAGHVFERVVLAVFENEHSAGLQHVAVKYHLGYSGQFGQGVRRVGEDEVELLAAALYETEHVAAQGYALVCAELGKTLLYEGVVVAVGLDAYYGGATARQQFERNTARARE